MTMSQVECREAKVPSETKSSPARETLRRTLAEVFGFETYLHGQEEVVTRLVGGKSVLAVFPTGGGKSVCYQLPAMVLDGLTLVISPLIALMKDQLDFLVARGAPAARLDSSLTREENLQLFDSLHAGQLKLLYISPERLGNERFLQTLRRQDISLLAIDEAHCISEWGHNFRPDYLKIARLAKELDVQRVLTLTATATPAVANDIAEAFDIARDDIVNTGFYRPNLSLRVTPCDAAGRDALLLSRLQERPPGPAIVYVTLQRTAEDVAAFLRGNGLDAMAYHAGMETDERNAIQDKFMASGRAIIVATIAFGMGVDKANIRYVYHYNLPKGLESYSQEIGRAGRDGEDSVCEMLACADDAVVLENFSYGDTPGIEAIASLVEDVLGRGPVFDVSVYELSRDHDIRSLVVKTLLTYLELDQVIASTGPFYSVYKFQPQKPSDQILARFDDRRAAFLRSVFSHARKGKTWLSLDLDAVSASLTVPRQRVMAALGYLEETGDLVVQASGVRQGYRIRQLPEDKDRLCESLDARFQRREDNDIARVRGMLEFAESDDCLTRHLLAYFGEQHGDCGHCCRCEGVRAQFLPRGPRPPLHATASDDLRRLHSEGHESLRTPRQITRFLCGIASPATSRAKLKGHAQFGTHSSVPFREVLAFVEEHMENAAV